jgi:hypothetical protein
MSDTNDDCLCGMWSCDFTSAGCTDPECDYCYPRMSVQKLTNLAANIAVGAALCLADENGYERCALRTVSEIEPWRPGCGRAVEGWEG